MNIIRSCDAGQMAVREFMLCGLEMTPAFKRDKIPYMLSLDHPFDADGDRLLMDLEHSTVSLVLSYGVGDNETAERIDFNGRFPLKLAHECAVTLEAMRQECFSTDAVLSACVAPLAKLDVVRDGNLAQFILHISEGFTATMGVPLDELTPFFLPV